MQAITKYTGLLVFGYLLLLSLSYSSGGRPAYQAIVTILVGVFIWFGVKILHALHHKHGVTRIFLGMLLIGAMIRFLWATLVPTQPFTDFQYYHENAIKLSQGTAVLPKNIGYTLLVSVGYRIHPSVLTGKIINATASTLTILFLYLVGSKLVNPKVGLIASFLFALLPSEILMVSVLGTEIVATTFGVITAFFIFRKTKDKLHFSATSSILYAGIFYALGFTVRFSLIFYFPAILLGLIFITYNNYKETGRSFFAFFLGVTIGLSLVLVTYSLSTSTQLSIKPLTTQDSLPFLSGTNLTTSGGWNQDDANLYLSWPVDKRDALARQEAIKRIKSNPVRFALFIPKKFAVLMAADDYGNIWSLHNIDWGIGNDLIGLISQSVYVFVLLFAFCAFKDFDLKNNVLPLIVLIVVLSTLLPHTVLEVQGRYHHYIMPFIVLLASNGIQDRTVCTQKL